MPCHLTIKGWSMEACEVQGWEGVKGERAVVAGEEMREGGREVDEVFSQPMAENKPNETSETTVMKRKEKTPKRVAHDKATVVNGPSRGQ